ncbi:MAG: hypothetical protein HZB49_16620 [Bradyrhizobium sp.]|nr:hypothetical protein [Bradyrhizobium sp.]
MAGADPSDVPPGSQCRIKARLSHEIKDNRCFWGAHARLIVSRAGESYVMTLRAECASPSDALRDQLSSTLRTIAKLGGNVELVSAGSLPNDGKVIADERPQQIRARGMDFAVCLALFPDDGWF